MFWHLALDKQRATLRLKASGQELGRGNKRASMQFCWLVVNGDRVQVNHTIKSVEFIL